MGRRSPLPPPPAPHTLVKLFRAPLQHQWHRQAGPGEQRHRNVLGKLQERSEGSGAARDGGPCPGLCTHPRGTALPVSDILYFIRL